MNVINYPEISMYLDGAWVTPLKYGCSFFFFFFNVYLFLRESARGEGQRQRERDRGSKAGSTLTAASLLWGSNSGTEP